MRTTQRRYVLSSLLMHPNPCYSVHELLHWFTVLMLVALIASIVSSAISLSLGFRVPSHSPSYGYQNNGRRLSALSMVPDRWTTRYCIVTLTSSLLLPFACSAVDPTQLLNYQRDGLVRGQVDRLYGEGDLAEQLKKLKQVQDTLDAADVAFVELPSGVSYREYREGKGSTTIGPGSEVAVQMSVRCKSFRTQKDPGGVQYFSTTNDLQGKDLVWTIGSGTYLPGLEEGMMGMKRTQKTLRSFKTSE